MWTWRKIMKIGWPEKKSNMEMLNIINELRQLMIKTLDIRKTKFFGHILRHNTFRENKQEKRKGTAEENKSEEYKEAIISGKL